MADYKTNCPHTSDHKPKCVCRHVFAGLSEQYYRFFNGQSHEYDLVCDQCKKYLDRIRINMKKVCHTCFEKIESDGEFVKFLGAPELTKNSGKLSFEHLRTPGPIIAGRSIRAIQPIVGVEGSKWVLVDSTSAVSILDLESFTLVTVTFLDLEKVNLNGKIGIKVSADGHYAAIVSRVNKIDGERDSNKGVVLDLHSGLETMVLDRGDYYTELSEFSIAFYDYNDKVYLVHATDWNRLDVSDPATGELVTERSFKQRPKEAWRFKYKAGSEFYGNLIVSPSNKRIADFGWCWGPYGALSSWSLPEWLEKNVWEADNGPSKFDMNSYQYYWDGAVCWINDNTICAWGIGDDDENLIAGAMIFDARNGKQLSWFPGPGPSLFTYDQYLFTTELEGNSTSVWDVESGKRLHQETDFTPHCYHHGSQQFLTALEDGSFIISYLSSPD